MKPIYRKLVIVWLGILAIMIVGIGIMDRTSQPNSVKPRADDIYSDINLYRVHNGLPRLAIDPRLELSAEIKAAWLDDQDLWGHYRSDISTEVRFAGKYYFSIGENLAEGFSSGREVVVAWEYSPEHNEILLGDYQDMGIFIRCREHLLAEDDPYNCLVVLHMGGN